MKYLNRIAMLTSAIVGYLAISACSDLLPKSESRTYSPWQNYEEAQETFDKIVPNETTVQELKALKLDPSQNSNITILNYSDVLRRFLPSPSINPADLDAGVKECIEAKTDCQGYEVNQSFEKRKRYGSFLLDFFSFRRRTDIAGWSFNGVLLMKNGLVIYKLTGGQPSIHSNQDEVNPLGPLQGFGNAAAGRIIP